MKVRELIEELSKLDPEKVVTATDYYAHDHWPITEIAEVDVIAYDNDETLFYPDHDRERKNKELDSQRRKVYRLL